MSSDGVSVVDRVLGMGLVKSCSDEGQFDCCPVSMTAMADKLVAFQSWDCLPIQMFSEST